VYQISTADISEAFTKDSGDRLYWRAEKKRLDAEQLRDGVLFATGNLDDAMGGPSADLTPAYLRRTVYGKVSRYKLDEYLQLFDFPSPSISAEKRFVTTVPLQRLFLMNSDFMQVEAEELAKKVANEPDNRARIKKAYQYVYGRDATEEEIGLGLSYLKSEPMVEYDEEKARVPAPGAGGKRGGRGGAGAKPQVADAPAEATPGADKPAADKPAADKPAADAGEAASGEVPAGDAAAGGDAAAAQPAGMGMGMMGGVGRRGAGGAAPEIKYDPTVWGRYAKILFSSSEFLFIN
jgi:hypothetical protein